MIRRASMIFVLVSVAIVPRFSHADFLVEVVASSAPNFLSSPSWSDYATAAVFSLENGAGNIGDRNTDPTAYEQFSDGMLISSNEMIVSNFASWRGQANPPAPFNLERGNRLHFGLHILGDGTMQFNMDQVEYEITSDDGNSLGFSGDLSGDNYSTVRVGIDWGADRMKGGGDDTTITSGPGTQLVDEFIYVGVGNAWDASTQPGPSDQDKLDQVRQSLFPDYPITVTGIYRLNDGGGNTLATGSTFVVVVPEPGAAVLLAGLVLSGFGFRRRR